MRDLSQTIVKLQDILDKSKNIMITMSAPDGDSVGSSIALKWILEQMDKKVDIICSFDLGGRFNQYPGNFSILIADIGRTDFSRYDVCFTLDAGHLSRLTRNELYPQGFHFPKNLEVVNIDHHESNDLFGTLNVNITDAPCTAQIIDALFKDKYIMTEDIATLMFASAVFDTGNFKFNVTADLFAFASKCLSHGVNTQIILDDYFNNRSIAQTKYEAVLLQRMEQQNNYIYTFAYHDDLEKYKIDIGKYLSATATIARDYLSSFKDADFGWVISERKHNIIKIEMRARSEDSPILDITKSLGGGGHKKACGAKIVDKSIEEVQDFILKYIQSVE